MDLGDIAGFEWDDGNRTKCQKHGLSIGEIEAVVLDSRRYLPDAAHSVTEERFNTVGLSPGDRPVFVVFTVRIVDGRPLVRPISARYMHRKEADRYAQAFSPLRE